MASPEPDSGGDASPSPGPPQDGSEPAKQDEAAPLLEAPTVATPSTPRSDRNLHKAPDQPAEEPAARPSLRGGPDDTRSACSVGEASKGAVFSIDSTCAASTLSGGTCSNTSLLPLLKASPPTPVGRIAGRYKVNLWRSSGGQPYGISFGSGSRAGEIVIAEDAPHLGLRKGDEVISINGQYVERVRECGQILTNSRDLELQLYHREPADDAEAEHHLTPLCGMCRESHGLPTCCEPCFNPPEPRCRAQAFPLRDLLLTTGPVPIDVYGSFAIQIVRISRKQPFGLVVAAIPEAEAEARGGADAELGAPRSQVGGHSTGPDDVVCASNVLSGDCCAEASADEAADPMEENVEDAPKVEPVTMFIKEHLPHLGLMEGDELLQINGVHANSVQTCKVALRTSMTLALELRRPGHAGLVRRLPEPSVAGASSVKDMNDHGGEDWLSGFWRRLGTRMRCLTSCCPPEDFSGIDRSHDLDLGKVFSDESYLQPACGQ
uniref:PDZ domain-containing protein n=1 Tax=Pyrodinium bahamense TaxID=73915 RepID=A0A7S0B844_9DINO